MQKSKGQITFRELSQGEFDSSTKNFNLPLTQNGFYGEWQKAIGKKVFRFKIEGDRLGRGFFQIIKYSLPFGKSYLYIPHGPIFEDDTSEEFWAQFREFCLGLIKKESSVFLRFDSVLKPDFISGRRTSYVKVPRILYDGSFQPKFESVIDLSRSEEEILAKMKKVNRYSIRQAERVDLVVKILDKNFLEYLDKFYDLICATAKRGGFYHLEKDYYKTIFYLCEKERNGFMTIISLDSEVLLVNFFVTYGDAVYFLFSGSENKNRRLGYTYLAQWETMKHAKKMGFKKYNLGAVVPDDNRYHFYKKWRGFSDFKRRFGGELVEYGNFYDLIYDRFWYSLYFLKKFLVSITTRA